MKAVQQLLSETRSIKHQVEAERSAARDREKHLAEKISPLEKELATCHTLTKELRETANETNHNWDD